MDYKLLTKETLDSWFDGVEFKTSPFKHQLVSIAFALGENLNNVMFLHGIGVGKTLIALYLLYLWNITGRTLVICPNSVIKTWREEIEKHTDFTYTVLKGSKEERWDKLTKEHADIWIINYEGLKLIGADRDNGAYKINSVYPKSLGFECIIIDESHKLKDANSLQTGIAQLFTKWSRYTILMTGTPIGRSVSDLFGQFLVLDNGKTFGTQYWSFMRQYFFKKFPADYEWIPKRLCKSCDELYINKLYHLSTHKLDYKQYEKKFPGKEKNSEDIILKIIANKCMRYSREECVDLPEKIYEVREISLTLEQREMITEIIAGLDIEELKGKKVEYHTQKIIQVTSGFLMTKDEIYDFKINPKLNELKEIISQMENKFIIYIQYVYEVKMIGKILSKMGLKYAELYGKTKNKEQEIDKFVNYEKYKCLLSNPRSGGEGINLQIANTIIYYSRGYIGNILRTQSEGRIHRAGQKKNCLIIDIIAENSIDEILFNSLKNKGNNIKDVLKYLQEFKK